MRLPALALWVCLGMAAMAQGQSVLLEVTLPADQVRSFLPGDGEVLSHTLRENVWPNNRTAYERNETVEFAVGRGLRSKESDRAKELSLSPGIVFGEGVLIVQGGWRVHKQINYFTDHFDGELQAAIEISYAQHQAFVDSHVQANWRPGKAAIVGFPALVILPLVENHVNRRLEQEINTRLTQMIEEKIEELRQQLRLPPSAVNQFVADITSRGIRLRAYDRPVRAIKVRLPKVLVYPKLIAGDAEFGGNGPHAQVSAQVALHQNAVRFTVSMAVEETKNRDNSKKWTHGQGTCSVDTAAVDGRALDILSVRNLTLHDDEIKGHSSKRLRTVFGRLELFGDRKGQDVGDYTRLELSTTAKALVLVAAD